jgi:signal transduction histidine kinase
MSEAMAVTGTTVDRSRGWAAYGQAWTRTPGSALYLLVVFPLAIAGIAVLTTMFSLGLGLIVLVVGLPLIWLTLMVARGFGIADRFLLQLTRRERIPEPDWNRPDDGRHGFWAALTRPLRNGHYWSALVHGAIVSPIVSTVAFALTVTWLSVGLGGLTYWFWGGFIPRDGGRGGGAVWGGYVSDAVPWLFGGWSAWDVEVVLYLVAGVLFTVTMPWVLGGLAAGHHAIAHGMLGRWPSDDLAVELRAEASARASAVRAEDADLRRLERDIHDGPQQRLLRIQLDADALERRIADGDTEAAARLARETREHAQSALDELRALSRGVAPPLLQDRGLAAALTALAAQSPVPVSAEIAPDVDHVPSEVARSVYFAVAELLANTTKHAGASRVTVSAERAGGALTVTVADDGRGGAVERAGHGLAGVRARVEGLRGGMSVHSPAGGPTRLVLTVPIGEDASPLS